MRKSLVVIASALLLAVAATATHDRLRYDSSVFADSEVSGRPTQVEYPPCVRGVREDRCVQLYERGVRRSYQRWLAAHGRGQQVADRAPAGRTYRACRSRSDDRCQQRARMARAGRPARTTRTQQAQRRPAQVRATRNTAAAARRPAQVRAATRQPVRVTTAAPRQRPAQRTPAPRRPGGTPGI
jgi:hypothetical protein